MTLARRLNAKTNSRKNKGAIGSGGGTDRESMTGSAHLMPYSDMSDDQVERYADRSLGRQRPPGSSLPRGNAVARKEPLRTEHEVGTRLVDKRRTPNTDKDNSGRGQNIFAGAGKKKPENPNVPAPRSSLKMMEGLELPGLGVPVTNQFDRIGTNKKVSELGQLPDLDQYIDMVPPVVPLSPMPMQQSPQDIDALIRAVLQSLALPQ